MRIAAFVTVIAIAAAGCQTQARMWEAEGIIRAEPSQAPGADYVVHLQNKVDFGLNPDDPENRRLVALRYLEKQCPTGVVVREDVIETGQYLTGRASRTYSLYIDCDGQVS